MKLRNITQAKINGDYIRRVVKRKGKVYVIKTRSK